MEKNDRGVGVPTTNGVCLVRHLMEGDQYCSENQKPSCAAITILLMEIRRLPLRSNCDINRKEWKRTQYSDRSRSAQVT